MRPEAHRLCLTLGGGGGFWKGKQLKSYTDQFLTLAHISAGVLSYGRLHHIFHFRTWGAKLSTEEKQLETHVVTMTLQGDTMSWFKVLLYLNCKWALHWFHMSKSNWMSSVAFPVSHLRELLKWHYICLKNGHRDDHQGYSNDRNYQVWKWSFQCFGDFWSLWPFLHHRIIPP